MSLAAVCLAARDALQESFGLDGNSCEVKFGPEPHPECGEFFLSVHPLAWTATVQDWNLGEMYQVGVTGTMKMGFAPKDRWGIEVWTKAETGLDAKMRQVLTALHHNQAARIAANVYITGGASGKVITPLQLVRIEIPKFRDHTWFTAALPETEHAVAECGVSQTIVFGASNREQSIDDMD